ncbi:hypothetical protein A3A52_02060 [Candidatus Woesebacteria bacterium RIFCSPLOWO2_01_FULL_39_14]|uniref:Polysaccharide biosynthesis protein C-terminal domain-containing protein n=1 Tax=Candidatus Woesebacteria bacterium RIFCSPLOWO2_01_FULL_39_14 TaxID=1802518 RepID=A0A1F8BNK6_9BACT|nr:MAG: Polysaccharide biosynthesis protein [Microgenomates group bacterium GW2011_GWC1_38_12]OGM65651.1 MAG: hypothetical protein A3A52_02060 [Candidatus Woesebacteria bacterium RIFCSPLOWO2_01_FULL_39_14]
MKKKISNFKFLISNYIRHPLFSGSAIMIFGTNLANFIAYIYHLAFGRILGPNEYGELATIITLIGLLTSFYSFTSMVIIKVVSASEDKEVTGFFRFLNKYLSKIGLIVAVIIFLASPLIASFIHIDLIKVSLIGPIFYFMLLGFVYKTFLQGLLRFTKIVIVTNLEMIGRLVLGLLFAYLGLSVFGGVSGILVTVILIFFLARYYLKDITSRLTFSQYKPGKELFKLSAPLVISSIAMNFFFSNDLVLVKHYFTTSEAGFYAAMATLGKIIFYGTGPVGAVMFPMISKRHSKSQGYRKIFLLSLFLTIAIASFVLLIYYFFPEMAVKLLYGVKYLYVSQYIFTFGLYMATFTTATLFLSYFLSIGKGKVAYAMVAASVLQVIGIIRFHENITSVIKVLLVLSLSLLLFLIIYYIYSKEFRKK